MTASGEPTISRNVGRREAGWRRTGSILMLVVAVSAGTASAQNTSLASLQGKVTDESAAPMPGVTVTVTGPALQVPQISVVSDGDGSYRIENLPVGVYRVA